MAVRAAASESVESSTAQWSFPLPPLPSSAWALLPVVLLSSPLIELRRRPVIAAVAAAIVFPVVMVAAAPLIAGAVHRGGGTPAAMHSRLLAERVAHEWRRVTDKPLKMVAGESDLAYGVAAYLPSRPSAFPDFSVSRGMRPVTEGRRLMLRITQPRWGSNATLPQFVPPITPGYWIVPARLEGVKMPSLR